MPGAVDTTLDYLSAAALSTAVAINASDIITTAGSLSGVNAQAAAQELTSITTAFTTLLSGAGAAAPSPAHAPAPAPSHN